MRPTALLVAIGVLLASSIANTAKAYEERLLFEVGAGPSLGLVSGASPGASIEIGVARGYGPSWSIGGSLRYAWYHVDPGPHRVAALLEATWQLDILRWVPRIAFGVGPAIVVDNGASLALATHVRIGADRLTDFGYFGLDLRLDGYGPGGGLSEARFALTLNGRVGFLFDRF